MTSKEKYLQKLGNKKSQAVIDAEERIKKRNKMAVKTLVKKVINYNDIPKEVLGDFEFNLMRGDFAQQCPSYLEVHFEEEDNSPLDIWFKETHPDLVKEESFLIVFDPIDLE